MESLSPSASFLCFLPEFRRSTAKTGFSSVVTDKNQIQSVSGNPFPLYASMDSPHGTLHLKARMSDIFLQGEKAPSGSLERRKAFYEGEEEMQEKLCKMSTEANGNYLSTGGTSRTRAHHEALVNTANIDSPTFKTSGTDNDQTVEDSSGETDIATFEAAEFLEAFQDGQEHKLSKLLEVSNILSSPMPLQPESVIVSARSSFPLMGQHNMSHKVPDSLDGGHNVGRKNPSSNLSRKWSGAFEIDSTNSFSEHVTLSGHTGHGPSPENISYLSDGSTSSSRLPYEWNSSPARMVAPDKRFTRRPWKHRALRLLCCHCSSLC
ncbi:hypothetical protein KP509_05G066400 [Ceratopteris richardii]|uniref:Uncharacterized protein n=1 Tax=Ceratopteris richardii TaxID=49495 RepID=A0A8T2UTV9_CERRI|nr:hypothetical protein KP509_05G066400 [Ceratopteris richardii]